MGLNSLVEAVATLRANPLRSLLSTLGVIMGVASLVAVLAVGDGVERFAREQISQTTDLHSVLVQPLASREVDGVRLPNHGYPVFTLDDADSVRVILPPGTRIELTAAGSGTLRATSFDRDRAAIVIGTLRGPDSLVAGRAISLDDNLAASPVAVISAQLASALGARPEALLGDSITLEGNGFEIVGVSPAFRGESVFRVIVPQALAETAMTPAVDPRVTALIATPDSLEHVAAVRAALERWVARRVPVGEGLVQVRSHQARLAQAEQGVLIFKLLMGTITGVSLLVGGIGIMNVLLAAVAERTREIGIRKAAGARRTDILIQFLAESATITLAGAVVGIGLGLAIAFGATAIMREQANVQIYAAFTAGTVLVAAVISIAIGVIFGMYPALRAARLDPIEAIRDE